MYILDDIEQTCRLIQTFKMWAERRLMLISFFQGGCFKSELFCRIDEWEKRIRGAVRTFPANSSFLQVFLHAILTSNSPTLAAKSLACSLVEYLTSLYVFAFALIWLSWLYLLDFKANSFGEPSWFMGCCCSGKKAVLRQWRRTLESLQHGRLAFVLLNVFRLCWTKSF